MVSHPCSSFYAVCGLRCHKRCLSFLKGSRDHRCRFAVLTKAARDRTCAFVSMHAREMGQSGESGPWIGNELRYKRTPTAQSLVCRLWQAC
jgi:hypothetical protein